MPQIHIKLLAFLMLVNVLFAESNRNIYDAEEVVISYAKENSDIICAIESKLENIHYNVSYLRGTAVEQILNAYVLINNRYIFHVLVPLNIHFSKEGEVLSICFGKGVKAQVREVVSVERKRGRIRSAYYGEIVDIESEKLDELLKADDLINNLGVDLNRSPTIPSDAAFYFF